jgi:hypothetical protein
MLLRRRSPILSLFVIVATLFAFAIDRHRTYNNELSEQTSNGHGPRSSLQASYTSGYDATFHRISFHPPRTQPADTTAIILNWSRLPNVVRIVDALCDQSLENTIVTILVWNNNPRALSQEVCTLICILPFMIGHQI